ncbi:MAG: GGDEF domain-containing protein [Rubrivivax sp.]|nr:GGDEF domain-containing protein [Rubrivivax sp.]
MGLISRARLALNVDNDALAAHRDGIRLRLSVMGGVVLLPFTLLHLLNANGLMFGVNIVMVTVMLGNAWALRQGRAPVVPFSMLGLVMTAGVCTSVLWQGVYGVFWSFPALFMLYFVLPRRLATVLGGVLLLATTATCAVSLGLPTAARVLMSLGFVLVMINVVLNVIGELQQALVTQAITDPLTGAYNRRHLQVHLAQRVAPAGAATGGDALLAIDIDHFKRVNDRHGHAVGDEVLCRLVAAIGARKRGSDLLFRTGGEEFVLLLPRTSPDAAVGVAEDLRQRVAQAALLPGETVTVSVGVAALAPGQTADAWVRAADRALYEAKRTGRNRVVVDTAG